VNASQVGAFLRDAAYRDRLWAPLPAATEEVVRVTITACPRCESPDIAVIGRQDEAVTCRQCGGTWAISAENPLYLNPIDGGHPFSRGECSECGRVLARTWGGDGVLIVHGPRAARCPGAGKQPARPRRIAAKVAR